MTKYFRGLINVLVSAILISPSAGASHLTDKSVKQAIEIHESRLRRLETGFYWPVVNVRSTQPVSQIDFNISESSDLETFFQQASLLSALVFRQGAVVLDESHEPLLDDDQQMYSMSIAKSFVGYLLAHAICDGYIEPEKKLVTYLPEAKGTVYENVSIKDLSDMRGSPKGIWGDRGLKRYQWESLDAYSRPIVSSRLAIADFLSAKTGDSSNDRNEFYYTSFSTDLLAKAIENSIPGRLVGYYQDKILKPAGFAGSLSYLPDKNWWPINHGGIYLARYDYLRFAILVSDSWKAEGCVGTYLRELQSNGSVIFSSYNHQVKYAGQFWFDSRLGHSSVLMTGHGGQRVLIDYEKNEIVILHSIREQGFNADQLLLKLKNR